MVFLSSFQSQANIFHQSLENLNTLFVIFHQFIKFSPPNLILKFRQASQTFIIISKVNLSSMFKSFSYQRLVKSTYERYLAKKKTFQLFSKYLKIVFHSFKDLKVQLMIDYIILRFNLLYLEVLYQFFNSSFAIFPKYGGAS